MKLKKIIYTSILTIIFGISLYISNKVTINDLNPKLLKIMKSTFTKELNQEFNVDILTIYLKTLNTNNHFKISEIDNKVALTIPVSNQKHDEAPLIYIYNTHSNEEYKYLKNDIYNIVPNVKTASYILEDELRKLGFNSIVEPLNTIDLVNQQNLLYKDSYKVSRTLLENQKIANDSLVYFIDLHRDSVDGSITSATINGEKYAKIMFLLGLENENYEENKKVITKLNDYINLNYPGLSRGIYEKKGKGVNGVYNQDFSPYTMLIEVGGVDNTILEVSNSLKVIASSLYNFINETKN